MNGMSFRASRRLSDLADRAAEEASEYVDADRSTSVEERASRLAQEDDLLREAVECSTLLDRQANARRKDAADPWNDDVLGDLQDARESAQSAVESRLSEVVEEAVDGEPQTDDDADAEGVTA